MTPHEPSAERITEVARVAAEIVGWGANGGAVLRLDALEAALARARQEGAEAMRGACMAALAKQRREHQRRMRVAEAGADSEGADIADMQDDAVMECERAVMALPTPPPAAQAQPKSCDYEKIVNDKQHGPAKHGRGGYHICQNCYDAMMQAERRWSEANTPVAQAQPPAGVGDEREAFTAFARQRWAYESIWFDGADRPQGKRPGSAYGQGWVPLDDIWAAWQARAAKGATR